MDIEKLSAVIRDVPDFPKEGIIFKDITPLLQHPELFRDYIDYLKQRYVQQKPDCIVGIESRGFIFGAPLAVELGCSFVPVRKKGKLPYKTIEASYSLEYGTATVEIHEDALTEGDNVVIIDDLIATGGTVKAAIGLVERLGGDIIGVEFLVELAFLKGRDNFPGYSVNSVIVVD